VQQLGCFGKRLCSVYYIQYFKRFKGELYRHSASSVPPRC